MKNYLRWSLRHLYLMVFGPRQFVCEVERQERRRAHFGHRERFRYVLKIAPWVLAVAAVGNLAAGLACQALGFEFRWRISWLAMTAGGALGLLFCLGCGLPFGTVLGLVGAATAGVAFGLGINLSAGIVAVLALCAAYGVTFGTVAHVDSSLKLTSESFLLNVLALSVPVSLVVGAVDGTAGGLAVGVACVLMSTSVKSAAQSISYTWDVGDAGVSLGVVFGMTNGCAFALMGFFQAGDSANRLTAGLVFGVAGGVLVFVLTSALVLLSHALFAPSPHQRQAALTALAEVAVSDLRVTSLSELPHITERLGWTVDAPDGDLPAELARSLPLFERVAQHVAQYFTMNNAYRKAEAFGHAAAEIEELRLSLIAARGGRARQLLRVADEWRDLLNAEREKVGTLADGSREIPNPFVYGKPVVETEDNVFTGRRDIVRQIEANMLGAAQTPTLLLHGPRRMGKTSILNQLPRLLGPDFAPAVVDCQNAAVTQSAWTLLSYLSRACSKGLRRRRVLVEPLARAALMREPFTVFDEWLDTVEGAMPGEMRVLLCLDEYERLGETLKAGWGGAVLDTLRHTLQHRRRVVLMFTGAHTFGESGPEWTDRFISARRVRVSFLERGDVELLLTRPIPEFDMRWGAGALDAMIAATSCQPFLTQAVAFELVQHLNERQRKEAAPEDVEAAIGRALVSGEAYFENLWSDAREDGQEVLRALAAGRTSPAAPTARAWLREHDILNDSGGFAVEMVRRWVRMKAA